MYSFNVVIKILPLSGTRVDKYYYYELSMRSSFSIDPFCLIYYYYLGCIQRFSLVLFQQTYIMLIRKSFHDHGGR